MNKKKILIINNGLAAGGIERASTSLGNYFQQQGYTVRVLALYKSVPFFQLEEGISFVEPTFSREDKGKFTYLLAMMVYVRKEVKAFSPNTILAFGEWTNPYVALACQGLGIPLYLSDRMNPLAKLPRLTGILKKVFYKRVSGIIAQTSFAKAVIYTNTGAKRIAVIPNPVNRIAPQENITPQKRIISIGRLSSEKGHATLIKAFARLPDTSWNLSLVGDGPERSVLERLASSLGVKDRIVFHGYMEDFSLPLSQSQLFVLPSIKEGFPNALIEAMAFPLPCISTRCFTDDTGIFVDGQNMHFVAPENIEELSMCLEKLISNEPLRQALVQQSVKIRAQLSFERIATRYLDLILGNEKID